MSYFPIYFIMKINISVLNYYNNKLRNWLLGRAKRNHSCSTNRWNWSFSPGCKLLT